MASGCSKWVWHIFSVSEWAFNGLSGCVYGLSGCFVVSVSVVGLWNSLWIQWDSIGVA